MEALTLISPSQLSPLNMLTPSLVKYTPHKPHMPHLDSFSSVRRFKGRKWTIKKTWAGFSSFPIDQDPYRVLRNAIIPLLHIFNLCHSSGKTPEQWKQVVISLSQRPQQETNQRTWPVSDVLPNFTAAVMAYRTTSEKFSHQRVVCWPPFFNSCFNAAIQWPWMSTEWQRSTRHFAVCDVWDL